MKTIIKAVLVVEPIEVSYFAVVSKPNIQARENTKEDSTAQKELLAMARVDGACMLSSIEFSSRFRKKIMTSTSIQMRGGTIAIGINKPM